ncbi:tat pathway signal sequence [Sarocladium strictum]
MRYSTSFVAGAAALSFGVAQAQYTLTNTYDASNFFDSFGFFNGQDPTNGFTEYVDGPTANANNLAGTVDGAIFMGVDKTTVNPPNGRQSVRLESHDTFTKGLFIMDASHMPASECGAWPAFWMFGDGSPGWPYQGEIDIIEGVNNQVSNINTLHTGPGCSITNDGAAESTHLEGTDCNAGNGNLGCGQQTNNNQNYGDGFNDVQGGVYATEWTTDFIAIWFFPRSAIPADITSGNPNPSSWGPPQARFNGGQGCNIDEHFYGHKIIFNITFCGDWAGNTDVWNNNPECSAKAPTCIEHVSNDPGAFDEAFWTVNYVKVFSANQSN